MKLMNSLKIIFKILLDQIAGFFPYFFIFYVICLSLSLFFVSWKLFFNWPAFNISLLFLGALSLLSEKWRSNWIVKKIQDKKKLLIKLVIISSILMYAIFQGINFVEFFILSFGLIAFFFKVDIILAGIISLLLLILCPILLSFGNDKLSELLAVYAYYLLIIVAVIQFKNFVFHKRITIKVKDVSHRRFNIHIKEVNY